MKVESDRYLQRVGARDPGLEERMDPAKNMTEQEWLERASEFDLRATAYHEAGHAIIGYHLGWHQIAQIWRDENPAPDQKLWRGRTISLETGARWDLVGLAGVAAECFEDDEEHNVTELDEFLLIGVVAMSESDAELAELGGVIVDDDHCEDLWHACNDVCDMVRRHWDEIEELAEQLISQARVNGQAHGG